VVRCAEQAPGEEFWLRMENVVVLETFYLVVDDFFFFFFLNGAVGVKNTTGMKNLKIINCCTLVML
jgi:hypothetical protein